MKVTKLIPTLALAVALTSTVFAKHENQMLIDENQHSVKTSDGQYPTHFPQSARGCLGVDGPYFDIEFLWWRATEDSLEYAQRISVTENANGIPIDLKSKDLDQDFEFDPGFRIGLGYNFCYDGWDVHASWTFHYTHPSTSVTGLPDPDQNIIGFLGLVPTNAGTVQFVRYERAKTNWQLQFNTWDLELGRDFYLGQYLSIKPTLGLKGAVIRQHLQADYFNSNIGNNTFPIGYPNHSFRGKSRWWGVGPKASMTGHWFFGPGFSLYGILSGALLYGEFTIRHKVDAIDTRIIVGRQTGFDGRDDFYRLRPMTQLAIGLEWSRCFMDWFFFSIHAGWETQYWWDQFEMFTLSDLTPEGDLSFTGLDVGFRMDF